MTCWQLGMNGFTLGDIRAAANTRDVSAIRNQGTSASAVQINRTSAVASASAFVMKYISASSFAPYNKGCGGYAYFTFFFFCSKGNGSGVKKKKI